MFGSPLAAPAHLAHVVFLMEGRYVHALAIQDYSAKPTDEAFFV